MGIKIEYKLPKWDETFKKHEYDFMLFLAAQMQTNRSMMFDADGADNGKEKWDELQFRSGRPLQATGTLRKSMAPQNDGMRPGRGRDSVLKVSGTTVTIGTELLYARLMNDGTTKMPGGVMTPKQAQALKIPLPSGKAASPAAKSLRKGARKDPDSGQKFIFRKSVRIPARPMDTITEEDKREWAESLSNYLAEVISGAN